jgi:hypothetical protein
MFIEKDVRKKLKMLSENFSVMNSQVQAFYMRPVTELQSFQKN